MPATVHTDQIVTDSGIALIAPGTRPDEVVAFEVEVVGFFVDAAELLGVPKSVAAIYGIVFSSPNPLSFSEIEERLVISKGSVSQGLRVLREVGAIKEATGVEPKVRNSQRYEPDMELRKLIRHFLETRLQAQLDAGSGRLQRIEAAMTPLESTGNVILSDRTKYLAGWHKKARALLPLIRSALILVPKK